jgi:ABC-2 type transport system ATP-binding protein
MNQVAHEPSRLVSVTGLFKSYHRVLALEDVGFSIHAGEILGLLGPNGAGKTTLFECLAGVQPFDRGEVRFEDGAGRTRHRVLFYVPDAITPWPDQRVEWVLDYAQHFFGGRHGARREVVERLSLAPLMMMRMGALSKGQRKRVLLAIGLLTPQPVLLIDEPFEGLDLRQGRDVAATLRWHASGGRTLFLSIHQITHAARFCDRFILLSSGRVCAEGAPEQLTALAAARSGGAQPADFEEVFLALTDTGAPLC